MRLLAMLLVLSGTGLAEDSFSAKIRDSIQRFLGRPYVWGAAGIKSFDCSGFVWRVAAESGFYFKRTTARKLYFSTRPAPENERGVFGNLIFFNDLKHVGIVNDSNSFYHAQSSKGTSLSQMTPYWTKLRGGEHRFFVPPSPRN